MNNEQYKAYLEKFKTELVVEFIESNSNIKLSNLAEFIFESASKLNLDINVEFYSARKLKLGIHYNSIPLWVAATVLYLLFESGWKPKKEQYMGIVYLVSFLYKEPNKDKILALLESYINTDLIKEQLEQVPFLYHK